jgi:hypothetical protein
MTPPLLWPITPLIDDPRPFDPDDAHRPSAAAALDDSVRAEGSASFADPFHYDWPHW